MTFQNSLRFVLTVGMALALGSAAAQQSAAPYFRPTGPIVVTYDDGKLTIQAFNAPLTGVLRAVANHIGVIVDIPPGPDEPVVGVFGPGSPRNVIAALLNGSHFNYVMTDSSSDGRLQQLLLTARTHAHKEPPRENKQQALASSPQTTAAVPPAAIEEPVPITSRDQLRAEVDALIAKASAHAAVEGSPVGENIEGDSTGIEQLRQFMETALKQADTLMATDSSVQGGMPSHSDFGGPPKSTNGDQRTRHRRR